ncbi:MAG: hypothetical protein V4653_06295 [Pseudomonadota bacterium]
MPTPIREAVLVAVASRLAAIIADVPIERAQRAEPAVEAMPCLIIQAGDMIADEEQSPGECFWRIEFTVQGYAAGASDLACEQALSLLHTRVVSALQAWDPPAPLVQFTTLDASFESFGVGESAQPAGVFAARFHAQAVTLSGNPYAP